MSRSIAPLLVTAVLASALPAQNLCEGNGIGLPYLHSTPAVIGGTFRADFGSPTAPNSFALLSFSGGTGPSVAPFVGPVCLDVASPIYVVLFFLLDGTGNIRFTANIPNNPAQFGLAPLYINAVVLDAAGLGMSKTARLQWEVRNSFDPLPATTARALHTATPLWRDARDNRHDVFVAGGATGSILTPTAIATTARWSPLHRAWTPGPLMSLPRSGHRAVLLLDGRVLITGGATTAGAGTPSCDLYDPVTNTIAPAASMGTPRMGHGISLLSDGRVLVTGGLPDWQNAAQQFAARLTGALDTTEIYDPATNTWTPGPTMAARRAGHTHTTLLDGRVFIVAGVNGGATILAGGFTPIQVPSFTDTCEFFDETTNQLSPAPAIPLGTSALGRGYHAASLLPSGRVLVSGGAASIGSYGAAACSNDCTVFDVAAGWSATASLSNGVAFHTQVDDAATGDVVILGGYTGEFGFAPASAQAGFHSGTQFTPAADLGTHAFLTGQMPTARAGHSCVALQDGTFFVWGGQTPDFTQTITDYADGYVFVR